MMTYKINFQPGTNRGSFALDAIAETVGGDWTNSTDDFGMIEHVEDEECMEQVLADDERVIDWTKVKE